MHTGQVASDSPLPDDTPPLSHSPSPSATSATRSSAASSSTSVGLAELNFRSVTSEIPLHKFDHDSPTSGSIREDSIKEEEYDRVVSETNGEADSGWKGYDEEFGRSQAIPRPRPSIPRQTSYSKRHSSFDTPREVPYPNGFLVTSIPGSSGSSSQERSSSVPSSSQQAQLDRQTFRKTEGNTSVDGTFEDESPSPPVSDQPQSISDQTTPSYDRYASPRPGALNPSKHMEYFPTSRHHFSPTGSSVTKTGISVPPSLTSEPTRKLPSPPILTDEPDGADTGPYRYVPSMTDSRPHYSLPPPVKLGSLYTPQAAPSRPSSLPHTSTKGYYSSLAAAPALPPPEPPTILTPPPDQDPARKLAPHEPFLPREQLPPKNTYMAVQTLPTEYTLVVRLPGFQRDSITLAMRKRRVLHIVADSWSDSGGHFERRVSFGYDADLASIRAEFDGETLKIIVPRRTPLRVGYNTASTRE